MEEEKEEYISKNGCKSLCWRCKNASNVKKCIWSRYCGLFKCVERLTREEMLKYMPIGVELDNKNNVTICPNFESDGLIWTREDKAKSLGLTLEEYKNIIKKIWRNKNNEKRN